MRRTLLLSVALVVVAGLVGPARAADEVIEVIPLRNRPAADLVSPLEAVLGGEATVTALDDKLIIRAPRRLMAEVRRAVAQLDVRPRDLWITVRQASDRETEGLSAGAAVVAGPGGVAAGGHLAQGESSHAGNDVHQVRALEGTPAWIALGEAVPVPTTVVAPSPGGTAVVSGTTYRQADRGFWVVTRLAGDRVTLEIETALDEARPGGAIETQGVSTTASGRLGEWIGLGEIAREAASQSSGILSTGRVQLSELRSVEVKVEQIP
jgi:hypothetical protein